MSDKPSEWIEAGITADESLGHPAKRTPEEGIKEMTERIALLEAQKKEALNTEENSECAADHTELNEETVDVLAEQADSQHKRVEEINRRIKAARTQLAAYELQLKNRN